MTTSTPKSKTTTTTKIHGMLDNVKIDFECYKYVERTKMWLRSDSNGSQFFDNRCVVEVCIQNSYSKLDLFSKWRWEHVESGANTIVNQLLQLVIATLTNSDSQSSFSTLFHSCLLEYNVVLNNTHTLTHSLIHLLSLLVESPLTRCHIVCMIEKLKINTNKPALTLWRDD